MVAEVLSYCKNDCQSDSILQKPLSRCLVCCESLKSQCVCERKRVTVYVCVCVCVRVCACVCCMLIFKFLDESQVPLHLPTQTHDNSPPCIHTPVHTRRNMTASIYR